MKIIGEVLLCHDGLYIDLGVRETILLESVGRDGRGELEEIDETFATDVGFHFGAEARGLLVLKIIFRELRFRVCGIVIQRLGFFLKLLEGAH